MKSIVRPVSGHLAAVALAAALAACGGAQVFGLTSDDNDSAALTQALAVRKLPAALAPHNGGGSPMVFAVTGGKARHLVAYDLGKGKAAWSVEADVQSRVAVGADFVVSREGKDLVARGLADGAPRWHAAIDGTFVGATADDRRAYVVYQSGDQVKPTWWLVAFDGGSGKELWRADSPGQLGAPSAQGGLVMAPFLTQWLSILDGATGKQLTRIRGIDQEISFVTTTADGAWFGSKAGVFRLDPAAASGARAKSTYGTAKVPAQLAKVTYAPDGFDAVQAGYSAADRTRIVWRAAPTGGAVIAAISAAGEVVALDPETGAVRGRAAIDVAGAPVLGATFDAEGWAPRGTDEAPSTVAALVAIARDRDARFDSVKELAVGTLAHLPGEQVTKDLLGMLADERTPAKLRDTVASVLVARADVGGLPALIEALSVKADLIANTQPAAIGPVARAVAALGDKPLDAAARTGAVQALLGQLWSPSLSIADAVEVVRALHAVGQGAERAPLRTYLMVYRADPEFAKADALVGAVVDALAGAGPDDRE
ncbi:MAG: PQQ-like beta-propeller repeat protein, partial [Deltaproteobacteria bacterium]|nr:PQQ-like beta-propeller repeat protein [Deltaproteobacteria bacterium]